MGKLPYEEEVDEVKTGNVRNDRLPHKAVQ